jgi:hypothetical protein
MDRSKLLLVLGAIAVVIAIQLGGPRTGLRAGDTVVPILMQQGKWTPGGVVSLAVRLQATDTEGKVRPLGFDGIRNNPVANVEFFAGESKLSSAQVTLSHRC